jgi:hypothetical protein
MTSLAIPAKAGVKDVLAESTQYFLTSLAIPAKAGVKDVFALIMTSLAISAKAGVKDVFALTRPAKAGVKASPWQYQRKLVSGRTEPNPIQMRHVRAIG